LTTLLKGAHLLDAKLDYLEADVLVSDEFIEAVGKFHSADRIIDLSGCTLMPGFIDAHAHVTSGGPYDGENLLAWAYNGVTTVRDLGLLSETDGAVYVKWLRNNDPERARVITAGKYIDVPGGYGCGPDPDMMVGIIAHSPEEAADAVTAQFNYGVDTIKIGIGDDNGPSGPVNKMPPEMIKAIADRCHRHGMKLTAHVMEAETLKMLVALGIDDAAHTPADKPIAPEVLKYMAENKITMITTIGDPDKKPPAGAPREFAEMMEKMGPIRRRVILENLMAFRNAGGTIAIGTDLIHSEDYRADASIPVAEMRQMAEAGFTFREIIACATLNAAKVCGTDAEEGSIEPGKRANFAAFRGSIDDRFTAFKNPVFVMNRGIVIRNQL
jgi:imidazolonepropionase-like amidohydrolase